LLVNTERSTCLSKVGLRRATTRYHEISPRFCNNLNILTCHLYIHLHLVHLHSAFSVQLLCNMQLNERCIFCMADRIPSVIARSSFSYRLSRTSKKEAELGRQTWHTGHKSMNTLYARQCEIKFMYYRFLPIGPDAKNCTSPYL
jgi:hypothetical protein